MNLRNCKCCFSILNQYVSSPICKECEEKYTKLVKEYLNENGKKTQQEIKEATGTPLQVIQYFLNTGILTEDEMVLSPEEKRKEKILLMKKLGEELKRSAAEVNNNEGKLTGFHIKGK